MNGTRRFDVVCLGEALVDLLPSRPGPLAEVPSFERHAGGAPANVAVGVARLGGRSAFIGTVGDDPFGQFLRTHLAHEGVDVSAMHLAAGHRTGIAFVSLNEAGQPRFLSAGRGGAELALSDREVSAFPIEAAWIFHLGTYALSSASVREAAFRAIARVRAAGGYIALDPNLRLHLWHDVAELGRLVPALLAQAEVVKLSSEECEFVTGTADAEVAALGLLEAGPSLAIVTVGPRGCVYARRADAVVEQGALPARPARVLDSTGAGDGFMAALLTGLARYRDVGLTPQALERHRLERLLSFALEAGTRVCEHVGAMAGLPTAAELGGFVIDGVESGPASRS